MALSITAANATQLAQALTGSGITISNVTFTGSANQSGTFSGGLSTAAADLSGITGIGFDTGIVLSTGIAHDAQLAPSASNPLSNHAAGESSTDLSGDGVSYLTSQTGYQTADAAILQFDFNPGNATTIYFNFVFVTDEYPYFTDSRDMFAALVNGTNAALIPGGNGPVMLEDFNSLHGRQYYKVAAGTANSDNNPAGFQTQTINNNITGQSVVIRASATVNANQINHISFMIADARDGLHDSLVFLQGASLVPSTVSTPPPPVLASGSDTGVSGDRITNSANPTISGTSVPGGVITLYDGATPVGTVIAGADGTWSISTSTLGEGVHNLTATETNGNGDVSAASGTLSITVDRTPLAAPGGPALAPASDSGTAGDGITTVAAPVITGTGTVGGTIALYDGQTLLGSTAVAGDGTWSITTSTLSLGIHSFTAKQIDSTGNASSPSAALSVTIIAPVVDNRLSVFDSSTGQNLAATPVTYAGPVSGLQDQYTNLTSHNLNVSVSSDNWFIHTGSGTDAIAAHGGTNVLDGGTGSNFLSGASGRDTFFVDDRAASADIWSTVTGFSAGDAATIWGVTPQDFNLTWADAQGAAGFTGLTLHATAPGRPTASLTLAGYSQADLTNLRLSYQFGTDTASNSAYMYVRGNG